MIADIPGWLAFAQEASLPTLSVAAIIYAVTKFISVLPHLRQTQAESDKSLRADLLHRVDELEGEVRSLRKALDGARISHAAEMMDMLHDLANESGQLDAAIMLAEVNPEALIQQLPALRQRRDEHRERMIIKRGAREATLLSAMETASASVAA